MKAQCPKCEHVFEAQRHAKGAGYALQQEHLTDKQTKLLSWWLGSQYVKTPLTKDQIMKNYNGATIGGLMGRVSELYALGLLERHERQKPTYPTVTYTINLDKAVKVLNNGGKLK